MSRFVPLIVLLACLVALPAAQMAEIRFEGGLVRPGAEGPGSDLYLSTAYEGGAFGWMLGQGPDYNRGMHRGRVLAGSLAEGNLRLEVAVNGDPWIPGGRGVYECTFSKQPDGTLAGTYTGTFQQIVRAGAPVVTATCAGAMSIALTPPQTAGDDFVPPAWNEHPRMLVRKSKLEALRAKAATPLGQALVAKIAAREKDPVALGVMYLLTGDAAYAAKARPIVEKKMADQSPGAFRGSDGAYARRVGEVVLAYDACYDAWDPAFRVKVEQYFAIRAERMLFRPNSITTKVNWAPNSNYSGHLNGASGLAGLAMFDKKVPEPTPPRDPGTEPRVIHPAEGFTPATGVPVQPLEIDRLPRQWLWVGPFPDEDNLGRDYFAETGGQAVARPAPGDQLGDGAVTHTWAPVPTEGFWERDGKPVLEFMGLTKKAYNTNVYLFTAIQVAERTRLQYREGSVDGNTIEGWISGEDLVDGDYVILEPGLHPLLVRAHIFKINPWGKTWTQPRFVTVTDADIEAGMVATRLLYDLEVARYQEDLAYWRQTDGASGLYRWLSLCGTVRATEYHRYTFGNGGFQVEGEGYTGVGCDMPIHFESCYRHVFGHPSTGRPDVTHYGPRHLAQTVYDDQGVHAHQSFSLTDGSINAARWALAFPVVPEAWKPAALWAWNKAMGLPGGNVGKRASEAAADAAFIEAFAKASGDPVNTLLHYPFELAAEHPEEAGFPKVWEAETKGLYVFRNGWQGPEDIVAQLFLKSEGEGGWQNKDGGSFRLWGLGHLWTHRGNGAGKTRERWAETVVVLPDDDENEGMRALKTHFEPRADGGGSVSADMGLIYRGQRVEVGENGKERRFKLVDNRFQLQTENLADIGISGSRALGVDYSGRSGAEALIVLVDDITGGGTKIWSWQLPDGKERGIADEEVAFDQHGFTLAKPDATLRATFITPQDLQIGMADTVLNILPAKDRAKEKVDVAIRAVQAHGRSDPAHGQFLVVITLSRGEPPTVSAEGDGLAATVTVGNQVVRYVDGAVVFGP